MYCMCDAPNVSEELPLPMAAPLRPPTLTAAQVRQYSYHHCVKRDVYDIRREFVGMSKQSNRISSVLPQQAPLVARINLMDVMRKVGRSERSKGKQMKDFIVKDLHQNREKTMTSLWLSRQKSERDNQPYSVILDDAEHRNTEIGHVSPYENDRSTLKPLKAKKEVEKAKFKCPESLNYDVMADDATLNSDVINRDNNVNKPVDRKRYVRREHSLVPKKEFLKSICSMCRKTWTNFALILVIVMSIIRGGVNINPPGRIRTSGLSSAVWQECETGNNSNSTNSFPLAFLQESAAATTNISKGICSCTRKVMFLNNNKQLTRDMKVFENTIRRSVTIFTNRSPSSRLKPCTPYCYATRAPTMFTKNVLAGKRFHTYVFSIADSWPSHVFYLDTYTVNLDSDNSFMAFYDLV